MKKGKNILVVGVAGALLLSVSGAVSPLNKTFAVGDTTALNTDQDLQKAKEEAIKKLDDYPEAYSDIKDLLDIIKSKYISMITDAKSKEEITATLKIVEEKDKQKKAKKENAGNEQNNPPQDSGSVQPPKENEQGGQPSALNEKEKEELELYKQKVKEELEKLKDLSAEDKATYKEKIETSDSIEKVNENLGLAKAKNTANKELKEAKEKALAELRKLFYLTATQSDQAEEEINKATEKAKVVETLNQAKAKNTAKKELEEARSNALAELRELLSLKETQRNQAEEEINKANSVAEVNEALAKAKELDKSKTLIETKKEALAELEKLDQLRNEEKESFKELINQAQDKKEVREVIIQASARNTDNKLLKEAKTRAIAELVKLDNLTNEEKDSFKAEINKTEIGRRVWDILEFAKAKGETKKAFKEIDSLKNLSEKRKKYYKELISMKLSYGIRETLRDAIIENRRAGVLKPEITKALEYLSTYKDLPEKHRDYFENVIEIAKNKEEIKKIIEGAKFTNDAIKEIKELKYLSYREKSKFIGYTSMFGPGEVIKLNKVKEALKNAKIQDNKNKIRVPQAIEVVENASNLTYDKATEIIEKLNNATTKDEVENILKEAGLELPKESGVAPDVTPTPTPNPNANTTPSPAPDVTPAPTPDVTPTPNPSPAPEVKAEWQKDEKGTKYQKENGSFAKAEWEPVNGTWYHFDENGYMQTGWLNLDGTWYYLNADGSMAKDTWIGTYYVDASGSWVVEGWQQNSYGWWYQRANGTYPHNEWEIINGIWYYFDENGYMLADTTTPDGYYVDVNGAWVN